MIDLLTKAATVVSFFLFSIPQVQAADLLAIHCDVTASEGDWKRSSEETYFLKLSSKRFCFSSCGLVLNAWDVSDRTIELRWGSRDFDPDAVVPMTGYDVIIDRTTGRLTGKYTVNAARLARMKLLGKCTISSQIPAPVAIALESQ